MTIDFRFVSFRFEPHRSISVVHKLSFATTAHRPSVPSLVYPAPNQISKPHLSGYCAILVEDVLTIKKSFAIAAFAT